jgi:hypothetical protein
LITFYRENRMLPLPPALGDAYLDADRTAIEAWWSALPAAEQENLTQLCDHRLDKCFFGVIADDGKHVVPKVHGGRFVPRENDPWGFDEWGLEYFYHLLDHPELVLIWDEPQRTFHYGCTRHPAAHRCWSTRHIPTNFNCPFQSQSCLLSPLRGMTITITTATASGGTSCPPFHG